MNCDQVFDVLTRGPFPTGHSSDRTVELHLADCPDCQRLANALRPAIELFQEAISGDEGRELPGYWGGMIDESEAYHPPGPLAQITRRLPAALHRRIDRGRRWVSTKTSGGSLRFVAAMLVGAALGAIVWSAGVPARETWPEDSRMAAAPLSTGGDKLSSPSTSGEMPGWGSRKPASEYSDSKVTLHLTEACLGNGAGASSKDSFGRARSAAISLADITRLNCCTRCHHARAEHAHPQATAAVARSCEVCHR